MDWIDGIQNALNYIEANLTEEIDCDRAAREAASSGYHFQRVFSILTGMTLGEYIRNRRLTLAGAELASGRIRVIDAALKYGYESPDSFAKAFKRFHGVLPSQAGGASLRSFSPLKISVKLEGASMMTYKIEEKPELILTGFKRRFTGSPEDDKRREQEYNFHVSTRVMQYVLAYMASDLETGINVITNIGDDGYDFYITADVNEDCRENWYNDLNDDEFASRYEFFTVPADLYMVCETDRAVIPSKFLPDLRRRAVAEWLPSSGYELDARPEITVDHWFYDPKDLRRMEDRYIELWLPIVKKA